MQMAFNQWPFAAEGGKKHHPGAFCRVRRAAASAHLLTCKPSTPEPPQSCTRGWTSSNDLCLGLCTEQCQLLPILGAGRRRSPVCFLCCVLSCSASRSGLGTAAGRPLGSASPGRSGTGSQRAPCPAAGGCLHTWALSGAVLEQPGWEVLLK